MAWASANAPKGVTYRGYLGATGNDTDLWLSQEEQKTAAADTLRMAERFTRTLETLADGFVLLDHEWRFVYLNPEAGRILRRPRRALVGCSLLAEFPETAAGSFIDRCRDAVRTHQPAEFTKFYPPLGIWVYFKVWPTQEGLTFCIRDDTDRITARREVLRLRAKLAAAGLAD